MTENRVVGLRQKGAIDDPLTEILRTGARRLIAQAVKAEFETFLASTAELVLPDGRQRVVRHGHDPVRAIQTGIGPVEVQKPKARDRAAASGERLRFSSNILPKWERRTKSLDALLPVVYLRGISAGDFQEALAALLGKDAPNLSAAVIGRLKSEWEDEYRRWQKRDLSARHYVYVWADGVYLQARMEPQAECMLVLMGATAEGKKELIGFQTGMRESGQSWKERLVDLKARGLVVAPQVAIGDGALGFWKALDEAFPTTRHQRCWLHKTLNVLDKLPKSMQPNAHKDLREIWLSPSRGAAEAAMTTFAEKYAPKYDKAVECLIKDQQTLLTFFDLPADHWDHSRIDLVSIHMRMCNRSDLQRIRNHHAFYERRQHPSNRHAIAGCLDHYLIGSQKGFAETFQRRPSHVDPARMPKPTTFPDHHLPEGSVGVDPNHTSHSSLLSAKSQRGAVGDTTTTDPRSRRNRASRRGGQLQTRAHSSTYENGLPTLSCSRCLSPGWSHHTPCSSRAQPNIGTDHSHTGYESDREHLRDGEASHRPHERRAVAGHRASHGVQTGDGRVQDLAAFERSKPVAESRQRYKVQRRNRSCRRNQIRRLIHAVTDFPA